MCDIAGFLRPRVDTQNAQNGVFMSTRSRFDPKRLFSPTRFHKIGLPGPSGCKRALNYSKAVPNSWTALWPDGRKALPRVEQTMKENH